MNSLRIEDPVLDPYFIEITEDQYCLMQKVVVLNASKVSDPSKLGTFQERYCHHYSRKLSETLKKVAKLKLIEQSQDESLTLQEYIERYDRIFENLVSKIKI